MKIKCLAERLKSASVFAKMVVSKRSTLPITSYAEIEAKDGRAILRVTNLEMMIMIDLFASIEEEGKALVPVRRLWQFAVHEEGSVVIEQKERKVRLSSVDDGDVEMSLATPALSDMVPMVEHGEAVYDVGELFVTNLGRAWLFAASEESRPVLTAVDVESDGNGKVCFAGADGFRLYSSWMKLDMPAGQWLVPRETCIFLQKIMAKKETIKVGMDVQKSRIWFRGEPDVMVISQLVQGTFPKYQMLIPKGEPLWKFTCSGPMLQSRALQFEGMIVRLSQTEDGFLRLAMKGEDEEEMFGAKIPATLVGDAGGKIALNREYLVGVSKMFAEMTMEVTNPSSPMKIYGDLENVEVVVMPMFVPW